MSIATEITRLQGAKSDLKTSIEGKGVTVPSATKIDGYAALVDQIQQGGGGTTVDPDADVRFFDYDGTLLHTYSAADFANLTELPANPSHQGLTAQGWNWTLANAQSYVAACGMLDIGQQYITDDGKTRLYMRLPQGRLTVPLNLYISTAGGVTVDWGDGSATETNASAGAFVPAFTHTYASSGDYMITLEVTSGTMTLGANYYSLFPTSSSDPLVIPNALYKVEIGSGVNEIPWLAFGNNSYMGMFGLESISIPTTVTTMGYQCFCGSMIKFLSIPSGVTQFYNAVNDCGKLEHIALSNTVKFVGESNFYNCCSLDRGAVPEANTSLANHTFSSCTTLKRVCMPDTVTSVGTNFCISCKAIVSVRLSANLASLGNYSLSTANSLQSLTIPSGLTTIGVGAFTNTWINEIAIPDAVTTIGTSALNGCRGLSYVSIGTGITSIGANAFGVCQSLAEFHITATTPPTLGSGALSGIPADCIIYVPSASLAAYQSATNWSTYASQMVGE